MGVDLQLETAYIDPAASHNINISVMPCFAMFLNF